MSKSNKIWSLMKFRAFVLNIVTAEILINEEFENHLLWVINRNIISTNLWQCLTEYEFWGYFLDYFLSNSFPRNHEKCCIAVLHVGSFIPKPKRRLFISNRIRKFMKCRKFILEIAIVEVMKNKIYERHLLGKVTQVVTSLQQNLIFTNFCQGINDYYVQLNFVH